MNKAKLLDILQRYKAGQITEQELLRYIIDQGVLRANEAVLDLHREQRHGINEVIFGEGKTAEQIIELVEQLYAQNKPLLVTRTSEDVYKVLKEKGYAVEFNPSARCIYSLNNQTSQKIGNVLIITAGLADKSVAEEARVCSEFFGNNTKVIYDVGVAGLHRLLAHIEDLQQANVIIVVAGMEGALPSVVGGLVGVPIIGVPTDVGYGASFKGVAALLGMLNSCASNVAVVNINNGFGAAYYATLINRRVCEK